MTEPEALHGLPPTPMPEPATPLGEPAFSPPGDTAYWHYRGESWHPPRPEIVSPMRVVRDDARGLAAWLASGQPSLGWALPDGRDGRSIPLERRFSPSARGLLRPARTRWRGPGILRLAEPGLPWSVWLFWTREGAFSGWYINLENPLRRNGSHLYSSDHILDLWVTADGHVQWKDEDELAAAVEQGRYTAEQAAIIRGHGEQARATIGTSWVFDPAWSRWQPDPTWGHLPLPDQASWELDLT
ncbi:DUF402 domain-containing protein [Dermacoccaceae bacterium W4C1]